MFYGKISSNGQYRRNVQSFIQIKWRISKNMIIKFEGKEISYNELFSIFFNKKENQTLIIEDVHPFNVISVRLVESNL